MKIYANANNGTGGGGNQIWFKITNRIFLTQFVDKICEISARAEFSELFAGCVTFVDAFWTNTILKVRQMPLLTAPTLSYKINTFYGYFNLQVASYIVSKTIKLMQKKEKYYLRMPPVSSA